MHILPAAAPSFDDPLEMLRACHGRIQAQCATLRKLLAYLPDHGCDQQARQAAQAVLRYFDTAGQHHHDDEENDLFPRLRATGNAEAITLTDQLLRDHVGMNAAWLHLRPLLLDLVGNQSASLDAGTVEHFITLYDRHIAVENGQLLPLAARLLDKSTLTIIGANMAKRRGVEFSL